MRHRKIPHYENTIANAAMLQVLLCSLLKIFQRRFPYGISYLKSGYYYFPKLNATVFLLVENYIISYILRYGQNEKVEITDTGQQRRC